VLYRVTIKASLIGTSDEKEWIEYIQGDVWEDVIANVGERISGKLSIDAHDMTPYQEGLCSECLRPIEQGWIKKKASHPENDPEYICSQCQLGE
jgi:hypothetical protein